MKKIGLVSVLLFLLAGSLNSQTKHVVMVSNNVFTPQDINITVGDTVEWQWVEGIHTTTSDDITGPDVWDSPITSSVPVFSVVITTEGVHNYHCIPHLALGMIGSITAMPLTAVDDQNTGISQFSLLQNYPNPFNPSTVIRYNLTGPSFVTLKVYNTLGNEVATLVNEQQESGEHFAVFDAAITKGLASGMYFYRLKAGNFEQTRKMLLVK
jgi:plastocyanin